MNTKEIRPAYLEVNLDRLIHNLKLIKEKIGHDTKLMATVKGNFYGLGIEDTLKYLDENGADEYAVAILDEAVELRNLGTKKDILILGYTPVEQYEELLKYEIMPTMYDLDDVKILSELAIKNQKVARIHIKVDTGMTRLGFDTSDESVKKVVEISKLEGIKIDGIFTHFTSSEEVDKTKSHKQAALYFDFCKRIEAFGVDLGLKHLSNSGATTDMPEYNADMVRNGYSLSGFHDKTVHYENLPVLMTTQLKARIARVRTVPAGTGVGYNSTFVTEKDETTIATIPIGYADGYKKNLANKGFVSVNGHMCPIRGNVCMDQMMIEVTGVDCKEGDEVVLFGYEEGTPSLFELAELAGTNNIDISSSINRRIPRVYIKDGEIVSIKNYLR